MESQNKAQYCPETENSSSCVEIELPYNLLQYLSSDDYNIQTLCRICLSTSNMEMFSLYFARKEKLLSEMFTFVTAINASPDDGLPSQICGLCRSQVVNFYKFKNKCHKSDCMLKSILLEDLGPKEKQLDNKTFDKKLIEDCSTVDLIKVEQKEDLDEVTDVQYLEDISDQDSDSETLCIVQNVSDIDELRKFIGNDPKDEDLAILETKRKKKLPENCIVSKTKKKSKFNSHNCTLCSKGFMYLKTLKNHMKQFHGSEKPQNSCPECKFSFNSAYDLKLHSIIHEAGPLWRCIECKKEFQEKSRLRRHIGRHMECKRYSCEACGKPFTELYALRRHARVHTGERVEKRLACHVCDKRYSDRSLLAAHVARHSGERPCVCAACGKAFPSARLLASHHLVHSDNKPYPCRYCSKRFRHKSTRNTHHRTHTGEKPYVCSVCGKTFIQNSNLTLHMRTHTGEKPYTCETCGRKFSSGSTLKSHLRGHTGEKPFSCKVCGKKFARMDMSAHMRRHTGERPYACGVCARAFTRQALLRDHSRVHTGEKPFECTMCEQKFTTKSRLVKHIKAHKSKEKVEQEVLIVRQVNNDQPYMLTDKFVITKENEKNSEERNVITEEIDDNKAFALYEDPFEVTGEVVLQDDGEIKTDLLVVEETQNNYQNETVCLSSNEVNFVNNEMNYASDVNLVTVNEGEVSISASSAVLDGTTVKLYQVDQSLVQIQTVGGQVMISKITSKMTANF